MHVNKLSITSLIETSRCRFTNSVRLLLKSKADTNVIDHKNNYKKYIYDIRMCWIRELLLLVPKTWNNINYVYNNNNIY